MNNSENWMNQKEREKCLCAPMTKNNILMSVVPISELFGFLCCSCRQLTGPPSFYRRPDKKKMNLLNLSIIEIANPPPVREEPEKIKKWREEQKARLEEKDREEEKKKLELREEAKKELEDWYKHHEESISKTKASNR